MQEIPFQVFVSYSRSDVNLVAPIVNIMRTTGASVFRDEDSIDPGKRWRVIITKTIEKAVTIVVFWSVNASGSREVAKEWRQAVNLHKDVVPVLLDSTPLVPELAEFNGIDFRSLLKNYEMTSERLKNSQTIELDSCDGNLEALQLQLESLEEKITVLKKERLLLMQKISELVAIEQMTSSPIYRNHLRNMIHEAHDKQDSFDSRLKALQEQVSKAKAKTTNEQKNGWLNKTARVRLAGILLEELYKRSTFGSIND